MNIPQTWTLAQLGNLTAQIVGGGTPSKTSAANFNGHIPFMTVKDLKARFVSSTVDHISEDALQSSATTKVPADTLIVATRMSLGKIARPTMDVAINQDLKALFLHSGVNKTFVEYFWRSKSQAIQSMGTGTTVKGIRLEEIRTLEVPLAPEAEQKRIADKLDTVLTRVDAVNTRLARVAPLLKRFRQSVLAAATSGAMSFDVIEKPLVPLGSVLSSLKTGPFGSSLHKADYVMGGTPLINPMHIIAGRISPSQNMTVNHETWTRLSEYQLAVNDVVIGRRGEMGRCAVVTEKESGWLCGTGSMKLTPTENLNPFYLQLFLSSPSTVSALEGESVGSTMVNLNQKILLNLMIYLPPIEEQIEIVRRVETLFAFADRLEARLAQAQTAATRLTPALLAKAFRGELVPQDPNDEPAAELLKRLAQSADAPKKKTRAKVAGA
ncbi:restriction endonuclease subunit S [Curvibacter sp. CHRR-16]|uniref:restriction endonuclease subunit S n=1 Tax=Curvibacter sp. CHRR-16 TaxID=2835872 RepID=UPI001BD9ECE4|nr:restriction endonuclease subunit S [Curvibacter sp. CHRR-16]MBT0570699.1 restriction endonuclease subunit S [Curvibacter sp. CHRR-16]